LSILFTKKKVAGSLHEKLRKIKPTRRIVSGFKVVAEEVCRENHDINTKPNTLFPSLVQFVRQLQEMEHRKVAKIS